MKSKILDYLVLVGSLVLLAVVSLASGFEIGKDMTEQAIETTTAKPIYQQRIGDEADPDILIIYEAEVDGVKVFPSVIKEAE